MDEIKRQQRAVWAAGHYPTLADTIRSIGPAVVALTGVGPGDEVLDVGCGDGTTAIAAAQAGARVTGLDLTPEMLVLAAERAARLDAVVTWVEGDAEALPVADESVDVVLSTFGCMFAPRHRVVAHELARVLRPGGRMGLATWPPAGVVGDLFRAMAAHLPPPPAAQEPPLRWGDPDHLADLFAGTGLTLELVPGTLDVRFDDVDHALEVYTERFGPLVTARERLEAEGRWRGLHDEVAAIVARHARPEPGGRTLFVYDYLAVLGRKAG